MPSGAFRLTNQMQVEVLVLLLSRLRLGLDSSMVDFGDETTVKRTVQLTGSAAKAVITEVRRPENSCFEGTLSGDRRSLEIQARVDSRSPKWNILESWMLITSDKEVPQLSLTLSFRIKHDYTVIPNRIETSGRLPSKGTLLVKPTHARQSVKVMRAVWEKAEGMVELKEMPHGLTRILYSLEKAEPKGASLHLFTDSKLQEEILIPVVSPE